MTPDPAGRNSRKEFLKSVGVEYGLVLESNDVGLPITGYVAQAPEPQVVSPPICPSTRGGLSPVIGVEEPRVPVRARPGFPRLKAGRAARVLPPPPLVASMAGRGNPQGPRTVVPAGKPTAYGNRPREAAQGSAAAAPGTERLAAAKPADASRQQPRGRCVMMVLMLMEMDNIEGSEGKDGPSNTYKEKEQDSQSNNNGGRDGYSVLPPMSELKFGSFEPASAPARIGRSRASKERVESAQLLHMSSLGKEPTVAHELAPSNAKQGLRINTSSNEGLPTVTLAEFFATARREEVQPPEHQADALQPLGQQAEAQQPLGQQAEPQQPAGKKADALQPAGHAVDVLHALQPARHAADVLQLPAAPDCPGILAHTTQLLQQSVADQLQAGCATGAQDSSELMFDDQYVATASQAVLMSSDEIHDEYSAEQSFRLRRMQKRSDIM
ncbi:hypothetical protein ZWY2020_007540 [Hordeum vulgare]|nr:hypothetical protein ZWY2020_007540 [Hordeum vulgare]